MGAIFPLSWGGKFALIAIAIFLGLIWSMFQFPQWWHKRLGKCLEKKELKEKKQRISKDILKERKQGEK